jgi:hypothetical protein
MSNTRRSGRKAGPPQPVSQSSRVGVSSGRIHGSHRQKLSALWNIDSFMPSLLTRSRRWDTSALEGGMGTLFCATMPQALYSSVAILPSLPAWFAISRVALTTCSRDPLHNLFSRQRISTARPHRRLGWSCTTRRHDAAGSSVRLRRC